MLVAVVTESNVEKTVAVVRFETAMRKKEHSPQRCGLGFLVVLNVVIESLVRAACY